MSTAVAPVRLTVAVFCLGLLVAGWTASRATAAFPGQNGKVAFTSLRDGNPEIYTMNPDGSGQTRLTNNSSFDAGTRWSADSQKLVFVSQRDGFDQEIYSMNANGSAQTRLTNNAGIDSEPTWSPNGQQIAFRSNRDGEADIWVMNPNGTSPTNLTPGDDGPSQTPSWSPDGQKIAFSRGDDIFVMNANGSSPVSLASSTGGLVSPDWSPDGQSIAYTDVGPGGNQVWVMNADGSGETNLTNSQPINDSGPAWSPDGQRIAYSRAGAGIRVMNANGSGQSPLPVGATDGQPNWGPIGDTDGDSLPDDWEENGVDVDGDGTADLDLPAMGADPDHKDIFIEVDFMAGHRIADAQIDAITQAFKNAPVPNPDNKTGITLHVDNGSGSTMDPVAGTTWGGLSDQESLTHQNVLGSDFTLGGQQRYDWSEFESIRQTKLLAARRPAFHYVIAAHSGPSQRFAGISRGATGGAADFIVATHENCPAPRPPLATECTPGPQNTPATFMHELGHNLGLQHGGTDEDARKPNYLSVMNYNFGWGLIVFDGVTPTSTSFELDYSRFNLGLNENALNEQTGFGIDSGPLTAFKTIFTCPNRTTRYPIPLTTQQIDWNCDRTIFGSTGNVSSDASGNGTIGQLSGPIDWNRIVFSGGGIGALNQPPPPDDTVIDEPTPDELQANRDLLEHGSPPPLDPPAEPKPRNDFTIGKAKRNKRKGTAKLTVSVPGPGDVELAQAKKVKGDEARTDAAGDATLTVKPKGKARKKLSSKGKAKVAAEVTYTPDGGSPSTQTASVKLARKR